MRKILIPVVLVAAVAVTLAMTLLRGEVPAEYRFVEVTRGDVRSAVTSTGTLQALNTIQIGTQISGKVSEIHADFNDRVTKNQLIARIDPVLLEQAVRTAEANLARNRAEVAQAQRDLDRIARLFEREAVTENDRDAARYRLEVAQAVLQASEIDVERARQNLAYTEIRSPVDGVVLDRTVDEGQTVAASLSAPQLFLIAEDLSKMEILASVDESDIGKIHNGQGVEFTVQAYPDSTFAGTVKQVRLQSTATENVVNYIVAIGVDNPGGRLLPGMTATVDFIVAETKDALRISNSALRFRPTDEMLAALRERRAAAAEGGTARAATEGAASDGTAAAAGRRRPDGGDGGTMLWTLRDGEPAPVPVRTGISDGQYTVVEGPALEEGLQVIAAVVTSSSSTSSSPFQGESTARRRGPPGP